MKYLSLFLSFALAASPSQFAIKEISSTAKFKSSLDVRTSSLVILEGEVGSGNQTFSIDTSRQDCSEDKLNPDLEPFDAAYLETVVRNRLDVSCRASARIAIKSAQGSLVYRSKRIFPSGTNLIESNGEATLWFSFIYENQLEKAFVGDDSNLSSLSEGTYRAILTVVSFCDGKRYKSRAKTSFSLSDVNNCE